ncbi:MAG: hypothetical protein HDS59_00270 [Barnesiella sp.]|nr:hypothetical protein [Barnesiella sp.]
MIKLTLPPKPEKLAQEEASLTQEFIESGKTKAVWKKDYIVDPLMEMSNGKCAYSEIKLGEESKYMHVEHFKHKDKYPEDVVKWGNLLPSCQKCNSTKGTVDMVATPIINPLFDEPREHLYVQAFRFYERDDKGDRTIKLVALNDNAHFVKPRFRTALNIISLIEANFKLLKCSDSNIEIAHNLSNLKSILDSCGPESEYSAVIATYLLYECPSVNEVMRYLKENGYWDEDFDKIFCTLESIALPK